MFETIVLCIKQTCSRKRSIDEGPQSGNPSNASPKGRKISNGDVTKGLGSATAGKALYPDLQQMSPPKGHKSNEYQMPNLLFYRNEVSFTPDSEFINDVHIRWWNDFETLKSNTECMQWLFPTCDEEQNSSSYALTPEEIKEMNADDIVVERILLSYRMMLHVYGMQLVDYTTGEVMKGINWVDRSSPSDHFVYVMQRIFSSLGDLGYDNLTDGLELFMENEPTFQYLMGTST